MLPGHNGHTCLDGPGERTWVSILSPRPGLPVWGTIINPVIVNTLTHYVPNPGRAGKWHTQPHVKNHADCPYCVMQVPVRWKGYLGCWSPETGRCFVAEITQDAARSCCALLVRTSSLRGLTLRLTRYGRQKNSPVLAELGKPVIERPLPPKLPVVAILLRLWGYNELNPPPSLDKLEIDGSETDLPSEGGAS